MEIIRAEYPSTSRAVFSRFVFPDFISLFLSFPFMSNTSPLLIRSLVRHLFPNPSPDLSPHFHLHMTPQSLFRRSPTGDDAHPCHAVGAPFTFFYLRENRNPKPETHRSASAPFGGIVLHCRVRAAVVAQPRCR